MAVEVENKYTTYLSFRVGKELFGIPVAGVHEVLEIPKITPVPRTPDFMRGVINLRGEVVPVLDLRMKLGVQKIENTIDTSVVVVEQKGESDEDGITFGALVDAVEEVFDLSAEEIEPPPNMGFQFDTHFLDGVGKRDQEFALLLNLRQVFSDAALPGQLGSE